MTCPHCRDTGISPGAPDDIGGQGTMSPCECDAGLAWVAWGGVMPDRVWQSAVNGVIVLSPTRPADRRNGETWFELIPIYAYRAQRDSLMGLLRQANDRADRAEDELARMKRGK